MDSISNKSINCMKGKGSCGCILLLCDGGCLFFLLLVRMERADNMNKNRVDISCRRHFIIHGEDY